jgi:hypothetical protein
MEGNRLCAGSTVNCFVNSINIVEKQACTQVALENVLCAQHELWKKQALMHVTKANQTTI